MKSLVSRFVKDESGATAIEYGLIAGLVSVVIITGLNLLGPKLNTLFTEISGGAPDSCCCPVIGSPSRQQAEGAGTLSASSRQTDRVGEIRDEA